MVAETTDKPKTKRRGFPPGASQTKIPLAVKLQIRGLYLVQQLGASEIGAKLQISARKIDNLAHREGWTKLRKSVAERAEAKSLAREVEQIDEVVDAVAIQTAALTVQTLEKASRAIAREDEDACRDLQALSQSAKNFNGIFREARGLNAERNAERTNGQTIVFVQLERVGASTAKRLPEPATREATEINVTPVAPANPPSNP